MTWTTLHILLSTALAELHLGSRRRASRVGESSPMRFRQAFPCSGDSFPLGGSAPKYGMKSVQRDFGKRIRFQAGFCAVELVVGPEGEGERGQPRSG